MPSCSIAASCGGCAYAGLPYEETLRIKQKKTEALLRGFGEVRPILGADDPYHYRNKVHQVFSRDKEGRVVSGYYGAGTHRVYCTPDCLLDDEKAQAVIATVRKLAAEYRLSVFDERKGSGFLRHVLVRRGYVTGEIMVVLVVTDPVFHGKNKFLEALLAAHPEIRSVILNLNDRRTTLVLGPKSVPLFGPGFIEDELLGLKFRISPSAFFQIDPPQTEKLYRTALEYAGLTGTETVIDAYCGTGTIGLCAAAKAGKLIGVELNAAAVRDARINAKQNGIGNAEFIAGDAGKFMTELAGAGGKADAVFMDPPRSGSSEAFLRACGVLAPSRIVYVSCDPATQARDLKLLQKEGYRAAAIQPVDMFPFTDSIETVVLLQRENALAAESSL